MIELVVAVSILAALGGLALCLAGVVVLASGLFRTKPLDPGTVEDTLYPHLSPGRRRFR